MAFPAYTAPARSIGNSGLTTDLNAAYAQLAALTKNQFADNIRRFVSGPGTTVTRATFDAALAAMPDEGGKLVLPAGTTISLTDTVVLNKAVWLEGHGKGELYHRRIPTEVKLSGGIPAFKITAPGCRLSAFRITGAGTSPAAGSKAVLIDIQEVAPFLAVAPYNYTGPLPGTYSLDYLSFYNVENSVWQQNGQEAQISYCDFIKFSNYGLYLENTLLPDGGDNSIVGCNFYPETVDAVAGVYQVSGGGAKFTSCKWNARAGGRMGYAFIGAYQGNTVDLIISGSIENTKFGGIKTTGAFKNIQILGTQFTLGDATNESCVKIDGATNVLVSGNIFDDPMQYPLQILNCAKVVVGHNLYKNTAPAYLFTGSVNVRNFDALTGVAAPTQTTGETTFTEPFTDPQNGRFIDSGIGTGTNQSTVGSGATLVPGTGGTGNYSARRTANTYNVAGRNVVAHFTQFMPASGQSSTNFVVGETGAAVLMSANTVRMVLQGGILYAQFGDAHGQFGQVPFNASTMSYWRIRFSADGATFYCDYGPDGAAWTNLLTQGAGAVPVGAAYIGVVAVNDGPPSGTSAKVASIVLS